MLGWRNLWYDEGTLQQLWELDLTGGKVPDNEKNALLSPDSKLLMGVMYSKGCVCLHLSSSSLQGSACKPCSFLIFPYNCSAGQELDRGDRNLLQGQAAEGDGHTCTPEVGGAI